MTPPILKMESRKVEKKLDEVISSGIEASEKSATCEKLNPDGDNTDTFFFENSSTGLLLFLRIFSDLACFIYTTSAPIAVTNLFFFIISLLGLIFTIIFIVSNALDTIQKSKNEDKDYRFEVVFCVTWSMLYGFFTTLIVIINYPVIVQIFCGYFSMVCYASDGYCKCLRKKRFTFENEDQRYWPIQRYESSGDNKFINTKINSDGPAQ
ncbi:uncharacterized protein LOC117181794 [Belonocnema kinseyi]|uniref:uncharacterized protein LOC117181794 n=1 Tax=Belonocnema kinseyi TaxID=2817044 RepID=UPI00143DBCEA|nr:uncharacterized protein LOC117181794 [Belonocnema kinseyi]